MHQRRDMRAAHTKNNNCLPPISGNEAHNLLLNCSRASFAADAEHQIGSNYFFGGKLLSHWFMCALGKQGERRREQSNCNIFSILMISVVGIYDGRSAHENEQQLGCNKL